VHQPARRLLACRPVAERQVRLADVTVEQPLRMMSGEGDVAGALQGQDWTATPLGPVAAWPHILRTLASLCLESEFPAAIAWGEGRALIYNEAYRRCCGVRHPEALGGDFADCWAALWPRFAPAFDAAASGRPARMADCAVAIPDRGAAREAHLTFSFSPVRDESGAVVAVMHVVEDGTARVVGERRAACLGDLAAAIGEAATSTTALALIDRKLGAYSTDLPFVLLYLLDEARGHARLACRVGLPAESAAAPAVIDLAGDASGTWPLAEVMRAGAATLVDGPAGRFGAPAASADGQAPSQALLLPVACAEMAPVTGVLVVGLSPRLPFDAAYRDFCLRLSSTLSGLLDAARAAEEERRQSEELRSVLMAELDHRVRNILASVQSMVTQTARGKPSRDDYVAVLRGRIAAMAHAHGLLTRQHWKGADVAEVLQEQLARYGAAVRLSGDPGCFIAPRDAINLTLAVHELATNAVSFGSLSAAGGRVDVRWSVADGREVPTVQLTWQESGGPPVPPVRHRGFGSQLIERTLRHVELSFEEAGVRCAIDIMLKQRDLTARVRPGVGAGPDKSRAPPPDAPLGGERVLVVEDEPGSANELCAVLEQAGAQVARTGAAAPDAAALARSGLSAAVVDVNRQAEIGFPIARRLLERGVRVFLLTGYEAIAVPPWLSEVPLLRKPLDAATLIERLAKSPAPGR
jgi:two-component sensor histidine kinase